MLQCSGELYSILPDIGVYSALRKIEVDWGNIGNFEVDICFPMRLMLQREDLKNAGILGVLGRIYIHVASHYQRQAGG